MTQKWEISWCLLEPLPMGGGDCHVIISTLTPTADVSEAEACKLHVWRACNSYDALKSACELTASIFTTEPMDAADYKDAAARIDAAIAAARAALSLAEQTK